MSTTYPKIVRNDLEVRRVELNYNENVLLVYCDDLGSNSKSVNFQKTYYLAFDKLRSSDIEEQIIQVMEEGHKLNENIQ